MAGGIIDVDNLRGSTPMMWRSESGLTHEEIEQVMSEDPGDRLDREAHGFTYDDSWRDPTVYCRNGCGLRYEDVVAGKIRKCTKATAKLRLLR